MINLSENVIEQMALEELRAFGWQVAFGPDIAPDEARSERTTYSDVVLIGRLREALERINPDMPEAAIEEVLRKVKSYLVAQSYQKLKLI